MNSADEHLIFDQLRLFGGYQVYPNEIGFVEVLSYMDLEICLSAHPNWKNIKKQPPLLVYDCPEFFNHPDLTDYFCENCDSEQHKNMICHGLNGREGIDDNGHKRHYRLVVFSAIDPSQPIAFAAFDVDLKEGTTSPDEELPVKNINCRCEFLYAYVLKEYRNLGVGAMLGYTMGSLFWQQILFLLNQIEGTESAVCPMIMSDSFTRGGEEIMKNLLREVKMFSKAERAAGIIDHLGKPQVIAN
ncbi:hypothetical protein [Flocculibacter collagenilyticus]|uniref:hypothetical protein n=1 Tax=Flocculibacter collagenilyticus TaxID=2744479 RepID=UPI0018F78752|nr:hypothetical protein [Flocculibacter collagenilyticus]